MVDPTYRGLVGWRVRPALVGVPSNDSTMSLAPSVAQRLAAPRDALVIGETLGRYRVRRKLGRGGMGEVYLARDLVLGRSVALKIVSGAYSDAFLDEARTIARLNHPHIVQLYDFGQYKSGRFLALEYIDGITLRDRARDALLEVDEVLRHARAIADALTHAHGSAVIHCDLKPSNVMIGSDGRVRVVDFGLARNADARQQVTGGTPDWMAPEQWLAAPLTDRVDSWALGVMTAEMLTGRHPLGSDPEERRRVACSSERRDLTCTRAVPAGLMQLIARSLERTPEERPSAIEWLRVIDEILAGRDDNVGEDCPYPGLAAFDEGHARHYFGREPEIDEFLERLRTTTCLPIVGPSGVGKSSFLHAGVIPRLRARERWLVLACRPGADPIAALAREIVEAGEDISQRIPTALRARATDLHGELVATPTLLAAKLATLARTRDARVLVAIDQLEEIFTQGAPEAERDAFVRMLVSAADDPDDPVRVVLTVRDDFLGNLAGIRSLFVMKRLGLDDLRRTIVSPLERVGYSLDDPAVVDRLMAEVANVEVADLPLLQFACRTLWDGRDQVARSLRRSTYDQMGGLAGALARHAEQALNGMTAGERRTARELLLSLISGTTRRSLPRDELAAAGGSQAQFVIDRLLTARLLVQRNHDGDAPLVEIAHESLLHTWSDLANWIEESKEERRFLDEIETATLLWEKRGRRVQDTWLGADLAAVRHRSTRLDVALPPRPEAFIVAGERRQRLLSRRRWLRGGIAIALLFGVAIPSTAMVSRYLDRERLIDSNSGEMDFVVQPFDWIDGKSQSVAIADFPALRWSLYSTAAGDANTPGALLEDSEATLLSETRESSRLTWRVRARSNELFLRIDGRGRDGTTCAPSWIRIQSFPGYVSQVRQLVVDVPTCQASTDDVVWVPAGKFMYGGAGDPASQHFGERDYDEPERPAPLDAYGLDRTEVSNAKFASFARIAVASGYRAPTYGSDGAHVHDADPTYPVTDIDWYTASGFCMYMGKSLPTDEEWVKAVRGGVQLDGAANPAARRLYPWGTQRSPQCVNQAGTEDGYEWTAPVDSFECGKGPYGHLNLVGNVDEWIGTRKGSLAVLRGGSVKSPPALDHTTSVFRNRRNPQYFDYSIGVRCATH